MLGRVSRNWITDTLLVRRKMSHSGKEFDNKNC